MRITSSLWRRRIQWVVRLEKINGVLTFLKDNTVTFIKWIVCAIFIGLTVGAAGTVFHFGLETVSGYLERFPWFIFLLPFGGIYVVGLYKIFNMEDDKGTNSIFISIRSNKRIRFMMGPLVFLGTVATHMLGGSAGREGAALQMGGSLAYNIGTLFKMDDKDKKLITMCGMSAAFAAMFGTPITAAIFSIEVISVGVMYYSALVPCIVSAVVGAQFAKACGAIPTTYKLLEIPSLDLPSFLRIAVLSVLVALLGIVFCFVLENSKKFFSKYIRNSFIRVAVCGCIVVMLTLIAGNHDYNGAGMNVISRAIAGDVRPEAFAVKMIFTAVTLSGGYRGGEIVPVFFTGATFGNTVSKLIGLNSSFGAGIGLVSLFCAVTNCPLTSLVLSIELFGAEGFIFFAVSIAISYMLSGYSGLYAEQKIMYSKLRPEFIDKKVD